MTPVQKQCLLAALGYYPHREIDGIWGPKSQAAWEAFESEHPGKTLLEAAASIVSETPISENTVVASITGNPELDAQLAERFKGIRYISPQEARCQCGGRYCNGFPKLPDRGMLELADDMRESAGAPLYRSSFLRCPQHNANEGGVKNSKHMDGKALDFRIEGMSGQQLLGLAKKDPRTSYAYIIGDGPYVHVDVK